MRYTNKVSVWPVAFVGQLLYETPLCENGKVIINRYFIQIEFLFCNTFLLCICKLR